MEAPTWFVSRLKVLAIVSAVLGAGIEIDRGSHDVVLLALIGVFLAGFSAATMFASSPRPLTRHPIEPATSRA